MRHMPLSHLVVMPVYRLVCRRGKVCYKKQFLCVRKGTIWDESWCAYRTLIASNYITNIIGLSNVNEHYCHFFLKVGLSDWAFPLSFSNAVLETAGIQTGYPLNGFLICLHFPKWFWRLPGHLVYVLLPVMIAAYLSSMFSCLTHVLVNVSAF